jgi:hypothetical protein
MTSEARAVRDTVPDDLQQGRPGEREVPHSDQWLERPKPVDGKMWKKNRRNIIQDNNGRAVPPGLIEEMFQARECRDSTLRGMHEAFYDAGRYCFKLPSSWNQPTLNKRISVRRIETPANDYVFSLVIGGEFGEQVLLVSIPPSYSIQEALGAIIVQSRKTGFGEDNKLTLSAAYESNHTVTFLLLDDAGEHVEFSMFSPDDDFWKMFNTTKEYSSETTEETEIEFRNVWDRRTLFLHASFVTDTTAGYLGRGGEFYPKPSKMYRHPNSSEFFVETSLDGYHKIPLPYENWVLELSLILDADVYQSP